jgi:hypothetical protein
MADGLGTTGANSALNNVLATGVWMQLHTGLPGAAGTANVATNNTRQQVTWGSAASGSASNSAAITWNAVPATETYTHASFWSASTAGNFWFSGAVTGGAVVSGNNFQIAIAGYVVSFTLAS